MLSFVNILIRICSLFPKDKSKIACHCEEQSDVTIHSGIASTSTCIIIEAMPLGIVAHSGGMLTMT